jgi:hypothetical protein
MPHPLSSLSVFLLRDEVSNNGSTLVLKYTIINIELLGEKQCTVYSFKYDELPIGTFYNKVGLYVHLTGLQQFKPPP